MVPCVRPNLRCAKAVGRAARKLAGRSRAAASFAILGPTQASEFELVLSAEPAGAWAVPLIRVTVALSEDSGDKRARRDLRFQLAAQPKDGAAVRGAQVAALTARSVSAVSRVLMA